MRPDTRPWGDNISQVNLDAKEKSSISSRVENNINRPLPWIVLLAIVATAAVCLAAWALWVNLDNRRILTDRIALQDASEKQRLDAQDAAIKERFDAQNQSASVRDRDIRDELRLVRNHVDALDNRVIVYSKLEDRYHAGSK